MRPVAWCAFWACAGLLLGQSLHKTSPRPRFSELTPQDNQRLDQQRALVAAAVKQRYGTAALTRTKKDLPILQRLLDEKAFAKSETYELQSLGVAFGDVLAVELQLRWVMISDEYGTDPTLRFRETNININALTIISKRVERDESVDLFRLLNQTREALAQAKANLR